MTLVFLGQTRAERVPDLLAAVVEASRGRAAPLLSPAGLRIMPRRLVALELDDEGDRAAALAAAAARGFARLALHEPEERRFWPHVTLARSRCGESPPRPSAPPPRAPPFRAPSLALFSSAGGRYERLGFLPLDGG